jgi:hypothetical protein
MCHKLDISSIAISRRRIANAWLFYASSAYIVMFSVQVFYIRTKGQQDWKIALLKAIGLLAGPFM